MGIPLRYLGARAFEEQVQLQDYWQSSSHSDGRGDHSGMIVYVNSSNLPYHGSPSPARWLGMGTSTGARPDNAGDPMDP